MTGCPADQRETEEEAALRAIGVVSLASRICDCACWDYAIDDATVAGAGERDAAMMRALEDIGVARLRYDPGGYRWLSVSAGPSPDDNPDEPRKRFRLWAVRWV